MLLKKENLPPIKQGVFYQLNLNKNNGPYLSKDIMYNNPKSKHLLATQSIFKQHQKYIQTPSEHNKTYKIQQNTQSKIENFNTVINFCQIQLQKCQKGSQCLRVQQMKLKLQFQGLYQNVSIQNNKLMEQYMPILKNISKKIKETFQNQKAQYYKIKKELQSMQMTKRTLEHAMIDCTRKIENFQKVFGVLVPMKDNFFATSSLTNNY